MRGGGCPASGTSGEPGCEESLLKGSTGQELTSLDFWGESFSTGMFRIAFWYAMDPT